MASKPNKTQITAVSVEDYLAGVTPDVRREDAFRLCEIMTRLSGEPARMWGPSIVGFGVRHYRYDSGREGEIMKVGFSPRKPAMSLYVAAGSADPALMARLGRFSVGKSCLYVKRLADIDLSVLETLISRALEKSGAPERSGAPETSGG